MRRLLEGNGWRLQRIKGSHHIYSKPGESEIISVPIHGNRSLKAASRIELGAMLVSSGRPLVPLWSNPICGKIVGERLADGVGG